MPTGGQIAPGSPCNPAIDHEACFIAAGFVARVTCSQGSWQKLADCAADEACAELPSGAGGRTSACLASRAGQDAGADAKSLDAIAATAVLDASEVADADVSVADADVSVSDADVSVAGADVSMADAKPVTDTKASKLDWKCGKETCANAYAPCAVNAACVQVVACMEACPSDMPCAAECMLAAGEDGVSQTMLGFLDCVQKACGKKEPACGDGACNGNESCASCDLDCGCPPDYACEEVPYKSGVVFHCEPKP